MIAAEVLAGHYNRDGDADKSLATSSRLPEKSGPIVMARSRNLDRVHVEREDAAVRLETDSRLAGSDDWHRRTSMPGSEIGILRDDRQGHHQEGSRGRARRNPSDHASSLDAERPPYVIADRSLLHGGMAVQGDWAVEAGGLHGRPEIFGSLKEATHAQRGSTLFSASTAGHPMERSSFFVGYQPHPSRPGIAPGRPRPVTIVRREHSGRSIPGHDGGVGYEPDRPRGHADNVRLYGLDHRPRSTSYSQVLFTDENGFGRIQTGFPISIPAPIETELSSAHVAGATVRTDLEGRAVMSRSARQDPFFVPQSSSLQAHPSHRPVHQVPSLAGPSDRPQQTRRSLPLPLDPHRPPEDRERVVGGSESRLGHGTQRNGQRLGARNTPLLAAAVGTLPLLSGSPPPAYGLESRSTGDGSGNNAARRVIHTRTSDDHPARLASGDTGGPPATRGKVQTRSDLQHQPAPCPSSPGIKSDPSLGLDMDLHESHLEYLVRRFEASYRGDKVSRFSAPNGTGELTIGKFLCS